MRQYAQLMKINTKYQYEILNYFYKLKWNENFPRYWIINQN